MPIGAPGCPELARCTASIANARIASAIFEELEGLASSGPLVSILVSLSDEDGAAGGQDWHTEPETREESDFSKMPAPAGPLRFASAIIARFPNHLWQALPARAGGLPGQRCFLRELPR